MQVTNLRLRLLLIAYSLRAGDSSGLRVGSCHREQGGQAGSASSSFITNLFIWRPASATGGPGPSLAPAQHHDGLVTRADSESDHVTESREGRQAQLVVALLLIYLSGGPPVPLEGQV